MGHKSRIPTNAFKISQCTTQSKQAHSTIWKIMLYNYKFKIHNNRAREVFIYLKPAGGVTVCRRGWSGKAAERAEKAIVNQVDQLIHQVDDVTTHKLMTTPYKGSTRYVGFPWIRFFLAPRKNCILCIFKRCFLIFLCFFSTCPSFVTLVFGVLPSLFCHIAKLWVCMITML